MKYFLILAMCFGAAYAQTSPYTGQSAFGYQDKRLKVDSTFSFATGCGSFTLRNGVSNMAALFYDSCGHRLGLWRPEYQTWQSLPLTGGGGSGGGISQVMAGYGLVVVNDSTLRVDTTLIATRGRLQYLIDSLAGTITGSTVNYIDSSVTVIQNIIDSSTHVTQNQGLQSVIGANGNLTQPNDVTLNNDSSYFAISSLGAGGSNTSKIGVIAAPEYNTVLVANATHSKVARGGTQIIGPKRLGFQSFAQQGLEAQLTINYHVLGIDTFPTSAKLPAFKVAFENYLTNNVDGHGVKLLSIFNEENNPIYRPITGTSATDYIAALSSAAVIAHNHGYKITGGGYTTGYAKWKVWRWLTDQGRSADASRFATAEFPTGQIAGLTNWATDGVHNDGVAFVNTTVAAMDTMAIDYVNIHLYFPSNDTSSTVIDTGSFRFMKEAFFALTHKPLITNEIGQYNANTNITSQILTGLTANAYPYAIWYSGDKTTTGIGAVALQDSSLALRPSGVVFANKLQAYNNADPSLQEVLKVIGKKIRLYQLKNNIAKDSVLATDTSGNLVQVLKGASGGGTVTSFSKTDGYGIISSVANPTTTPNHTVAVDSAALSLNYLRRKDSAQYVTPTARDTASLAQSNKTNLKLNISDTANLLSKSDSTRYATYPSVPVRARTAISLTTTGSSGAATYNNTTGVLNVPSYAGGGGSGDSTFKRLGWFNVKDYGAPGDGKFCYGSITSGSSTFTASANYFAATDVGKIIVIVGAGTSGQTFKGTIATYTSATTVTLSGAAGTTVTGALSVFGNDNTTFIQAAINAAYLHKGGIVYMPNGIYLINGALQNNVGGLNMNCQIYLPAPSTPIDTTRTQIKILGETPPSYTEYGAYLAANYNTFNGVVLLSTLTTFTSANQAIIGTNGQTLTGSHFNYNYLTVENLALKSLDNPTGSGPVIGGISMKYGASLIAKQCTFVPIGQATLSTIPLNDISGFETPDDGSETFSTLTDVLAGGVRSGFKIGEHAVLSQVQGFVNYYSFNFKSASHASYAGRICSQWSANDVYFSGNQTVNIAQLDNEVMVASYSGGKWYDNLFTINDSLSRGTGSITYNLVKVAVGRQNSLFLKNGAINLATNALDSLKFANLEKSNTFSTNQTIKSASDAYITLNTTGTTSQNLIRFQRNGTTKWSFVTDIAANGTDDFAIYDFANSKNRIYGATNGTINVGGTANSNTTTGLSVSASGVATTPIRLAVGTSTSSDLFSVQGASSSGGGVQASIKNTNSSGDTRLAITNSAGSGMYAQMTGSGYSIPNAATFFTSGTVNALSFLTNGDVATGGTTPIVFSTGGYAASTERFRISPTGLWSLNQNVAGTANQIPGVNSGATAMEWKSIAGGNGVTVSNTANTITINGAAANQTTLTASGTGSTAVSLTLPASATWVMIGAQNSAAAGILYWTLSGTTVTINYTTAPTTGTNNLSYWVQYK